MTKITVETTAVYAKNQNIAVRRLTNLFAPIMTLDELIELRLAQMVQNNSFVRQELVHGQMRRFELISFIPPAPSRGGGVTLTLEMPDDRAQDLGKLAALALDNMGDLFMGARIQAKQIIFAVPYMMGAVKTRNYKHPIGGGKFAFLERVQPKVHVPAHA